MKRFGYFVLGLGALVLGLIGVVLPGLPTTPFLLVAAFAFGRSSPRLRMWIENHATFGPPIRDWEDRGAISRRAKILAVSMMGVVLAMSLVIGVPLWALGVQALCMGGAATFVLTRPD
ncbi:MAG: YbaN family protein [Maritimibacter sp.]